MFLKKVRLLYKIRIDRTSLSRHYFSKQKGLKQVSESGEEIDLIWWILK